MNTRGLMELVVLNIGLDLGVISASLFAMMVTMALVTTVATGPVLQLLGVVPMGRFIRAKPGDGCREGATGEERNDLERSAAGVHARI